MKSISQKNNFNSVNLSVRYTTKRYLKFVCKKRTQITCNSVDFFADDSNAYNQKENVIDKFTINISEKAANGKFNKIIGREDELKQIQQVLLKRTKKNPLIVGDAGVGKTALVEELARRMVFDKTLNAELCENEIIQLDVLSIMTGTSMRGELEKNITDLLKDIIERENVILFIDEIHSLVSSSDAQNKKSSSASAKGVNFFDILKPPLSRGQITVIGATTYDEYCKYFKKDSALDRRFQRVDIEEPTPERTIEMIKSIKNGYEEYHKCMIMDAALEKSVELSNKYLPYRQFPDKAIDLIDEACSKVTIESFKEKTHVKIVDIIDIENVINEINGIDITNMQMSAKDKIDAIEKQFQRYVIGQDIAVTNVLKTLKRHSCGIHDDRRPVCSMLFVGPTGVGKTSLCKMIAKEYYGNDKHLIRFDMTEYMDSFSLSTLIGAPPGYVGYDKGGTLTNAVRYNPCSVILFDEIEKAHPDVLNVLLQILEDGVLTDSFKKTYSFKNNIIVMTSNAYTEVTNFNMLLNDEEDTQLRTMSKMKDVKENLTMYFKPEFLNRIDEIIVFDRLTYENLQQICDIYIQDAKERIMKKTNKRIHINISKETYQMMLSNIEHNSIKDGARPIKRIVEEFIIDPVTDYILQNNYENEKNVSYINL